MTCAEEDILITRGSQMAIDLVARTVLSPGDRVAVEALGYRPAWDALRWAGAELVAVPVDGQGLDVAHLEELARDRPIRAVYLTSHHHFPTTVVLSAARRMQLLTLAQRHRWMLLEDDYDSEFHYEGRPVAPTAWAHACSRAGLRLAVPAQYAFAAPAPNALRFAFSPLRRNELLQAVAIAARNLTLAHRGRHLRGRRS